MGNLYLILLINRCIIVSYTEESDKESVILSVVYTLGMEKDPTSSAEMKTIEILTWTNQQDSV